MLTWSGQLQNGESENKMVLKAGGRTETFFVVVVAAIGILIGAEIEKEQSKSTFIPCGYILGCLSFL